MTEKKSTSELPATERQRTYLDTLGVSPPSNLTRRRATELILEAKETAPATPKQIAYLNILCVVYDPQLTKIEASRLIDDAIPDNWAASDFAEYLFWLEHQPLRGPNGKFAPGNWKGVTREKCSDEIEKIRKIIMANESLRLAANEFKCRNSTSPLDYHLVAKFVYSQMNRQPAIERPSSVHWLTVLARSLRRMPIVGQFLGPRKMDQTARDGQ